MVWWQWCGISRLYCVLTVCVLRKSILNTTIKHFSAFSSIYQDEKRYESMNADPKVKLPAKSTVWLADHTRNTIVMSKSSFHISLLDWLKDEHEKSTFPFIMTLTSSIMTLTLSISHFEMKNQSLDLASSQLFSFHLWSLKKYSKSLLNWKLGLVPKSESKIDSFGSYKTLVKKVVQNLSKTKKKRDLGPNIVETKIAPP